SRPIALFRAKRIGRHPLDLTPTITKFINFTTMDMATEMECQNIPLPTSRPGTPELLSPCEKLKLIHKNLKKYLLLAQGTEQSLKLLAPHMKADEPEVIDLFARLNFYQEQHRNAECE
ncbi:hypothetical protein TNCV_3446181, partial [Trichonephila clavipes]